ncbi:MAG: 4-hydroxy-3-methylbut-2-enyl diphosphate reductase, partial [Firmicutes bacterium]|nr:4-hydroxy-3-methylbut-2-enyl diphosphate reductase [Bacillota bacterium]
MIEVAKTAGFCYGVKRAVDGVYKAAENEKIATLGHIIHNPQVISDLESKGVLSYERVSDIPSDAAVIIRAHGVAKSVYKELEGRRYVDLTCPYVKRIHNIVEEQYNNGYDIVIVGDKSHPEVVGINGWCADSALILYDENDERIGNLAQKNV